VQIRSTLNRPLPTALVAIIALAAAGSAHAGEPITVEVHHSSFNVASMIPGEGTPHGTVELGDIVRWVWMSDFHSVTSDTSVFDSGIESMPFQFEHTFSELGTFPYHCILHGGPGGQGMSGTITVVPAPGAGAMMLGAAGLFAARRRR
jgi:plastocyanin